MKTPSTARISSSNINRTPKAGKAMYENHFPVGQTLSSTLPSNRKSSTGSTLHKYNTHSAGTNASPSLNIVALLDNQAREVGFAVFNLRTNSVRLTQYNEGSSYINTCNMLKVYEPAEVLFPKTLYDTKLSSVVKQELESNSEGTSNKAKITFIARKLFNENKGNEYINTLLMDHENSSIQSDVVSKYLSVSALSAVIQYVEYVQEITFQPRSLRISYVACDGHLMIDSSSISSLELVRSLKYGNGVSTLLSHLDYTKTPMGKRILRTNLLQPLLDITSLNARLDTVDEILANEKEFFEVGALLSEFNIDIAHLLTQFTHTKRSSSARCSHSCVLNIICLRKIIEKVPLLEEKLRSYTTPILKAISQSLEYQELSSLKQSIDEIINEKGIVNCKNKQQQVIFSVAANVDALLDIGRKKYIETVEEIQSHHKYCQAETGVSSLKLRYNVRRGYHFTYEDNVHLSHEAQKLLIQRLKKGKIVHCSTEELNSLNVRMKEILDEIYLMTEMVVSRLTEIIKTHISDLYKLGESIGLLDMLFSFATLVTLNNSYIRPQFCTEGPTAIKQGRHPVLEKNLNGEYVANDTYLSESSNFHIITGANMSGKSTYLKQVACIQIISQIGCYVPCSYCNIRIADRIFTRIGNNDNIENNSSTFMVEMKEVTNIVQNVTNKSLIIIDELGRSSSNIEGTAIAWSIAEHLSSLRSYSLFATHYTEMSDLENLYPNIKNSHLRVTTTQDGELNYLYQLQPGSCSEDRYGIKLAKMLGINSAIINESEIILEELIKKKQKPQHDDQSNKEWKLVFGIASKLIAHSDSEYEMFKDTVLKLKQALN
ncbi:hypothetical protein FDP41_007901 [Naegleria fowleri]|uniref:DNA mismatch repair proteins mutS family domain-containing protein n=1 Tax=Naegleria fowleri TaxID=5763 RepID=A0A6A5C895_NAEFO|nr:uncharacterized protein FDP41_007901 [Naegleria fowleri]KAF0983986.1 hypothetical protein FDP41_007901 [Naegleria fowleri]